MKLLAAIALWLAPIAALAQGVVLPSNSALQAQIAAAQSAAATAQTQAQAASQAAAAAQTLASAFSTYTDAQAIAANAAPIATAVAPLVRTFNGIAPTNGALTIPTTTFIAGFTPTAPGTWANLNSLSACNAARLGSYAVVSDLYSGASSTNEVARCSNSGTSYYWRPQRTDYAANITTTGGTLTLGCGVSAPTAFVAGTLATNLTITAVTTNCWPGATFQIANNLNLGLYGVTLGGLLGSATKTLGVNVRMTIVFDGSGFQAF